MYYYGIYYSNDKIIKQIMSWIQNKKPIIALAPMADMTDSPFCRICREVAGKNFVIFREMISTEAIIRGNEKTLKMCEFEEIERPIVIQIFGSDPNKMVQAAKIIVEKYHPDGIDINMGCPVPKITKKNLAGASLMQDHERAINIVKALKNANLGIPISVKTRLGWGSDEEILEFAPKLERAGADLISIHGRTKIQGYSGKANWEKIRKVKKLLKIPLIANGDINSKEDIEKCLKITQAEGIMIGRGALGNPWIFLNNKELQTKHNINEIKKVVLNHAQLHLEHYGEQFGLKTFRKHLLLYFKGFSGIKDLKKELVKVNTEEDLKNVLQKIR